MGKTRTTAAIYLVFSALLALGCEPAPPPGSSPGNSAGSSQSASPRPTSTDRDTAPEQELSHTFSIVAVDPDTGVCGAAVASLFPKVGEVVPYVKSDVGAFCTQHYHRPEFGPRALELLAQGKSPEAVLTDLLAGDDRPEQRQLAIIDRHGRAANHNPTQAGAGSRWWGAMSGRFYSCQGNTLRGSDVVVAMARAYESTEGSLADRLMAALVAGDDAGGDHRGRLAAGIIVAKRGVDGDWLNLQVDGSRDATNELAKKYVALDHEALGAWAKANRPWKPSRTDKSAEDRPGETPNE